MRETSLDFIIIFRGIDVLWRLLNLYELNFDAYHTVWLIRDILLPFIIILISNSDCVLFLLSLLTFG